MADHDVIVVGDGPAGAAAAAALAELGVDVVVVGQGKRWPNHYGVWLDEVPTLPANAFTATRDRVVVVGARRHEIERSYGMLDNQAVRTHLGLDAHLIRDAMTRLTVRRSHVEVELLDGEPITGHHVVDASGPNGAEPVAWQTAYGVVVGADVVRSQFTAEAVTLMDWSVTGEAPTFCYVVPVAGGWLVEETSLASRHPVGVDVLRAKLARRIGEGVVADAEELGAVDEVHLPMGLPPARSTDRVIPFGAAAGLIHPVTGYSVAASLRLAPTLAQAIAAGTRDAAPVWSPGMRRTRALHDYGLEAMLRFDGERVTDFFDAFFGLPVERWAPYLRVDATPGEVMSVMRGVFRASPWSVRRGLVRFDGGVARRLVRG